MPTNPKCPPLAGKKGTPALESAMNNNPGINVEPNMAASKGPDNPDMQEGYSKGSLNHSPDEEKLFAGFREGMSYE